MAISENEFESERAWRIPCAHDVRFHAWTQRQTCGGWTVVEREGWQGVADADSAVALPIIHDSVRLEPAGPDVWACAEIGGRMQCTYLKDNHGKNSRQTLTLPGLCLDAVVMSRHMLAFRTDGGWGCFNPMAGEMTFAPQYADVGEISPGSDMYWAHDACGNVEVKDTRSGGGYVLHGIERILTPDRQTTIQRKIDGSPFLLAMDRQGRVRCYNASGNEDPTALRSIAVSNRGRLRLITQSPKRSGLRPIIADAFGAVLND